MAHALTAEGADASEDGTGRGTPIVVVQRGREDGAQVEFSEGVTPALRTPGGGSSHPMVMAPVVAATLTGSHSPSGNPGRRQHDEYNLVAYTLNANYGRTTDAAGSHGTGPKNLIADASVRRLTPLECERLQGFPDGWTEGESDSTRYRMLGNAVCVPVAEWIGRRLVA